MYTVFFRFFLFFFEKSMYILGQLDIMILSNGGMVMQFTNSLAYTKALSRGIKLVDVNFRVLAKMDYDRRFEELIEYAQEALKNVDVTYFIRSEDERDEMEYEIHMTMQADLDSYLTNEIREIVRLKEEIVF